MSSLPGYTLEAFLAWNYNLTVEDQGEANPSLGIAEVLGNIQPRKHLTKEQLSTLVSYFEPHREYIERMLEEFDEGKQSWRGYAGAVFDVIPEAIYVSGQVYIDSLTKKD